MFYVYVHGMKHGLIPKSPEKKNEHGVLTVIVTWQANNKKTHLLIVSATHQNSDFGNGGALGESHVLGTWVPVSPICRALAAVTAGQTNFSPVPLVIFSYYPLVMTNIALGKIHHC